MLRQNLTQAQDCARVWSLVTCMKCINNTFKESYVLGLLNAHMLTDIPRNNTSKNAFRSERPFLSKDWWIQLKSLALSVVSV